jgi:hypothetical protein
MCHPVSYSIHCHPASDKSPYDHDFQTALLPLTITYYASRLPEKTYSRAGAEADSWSLLQCHREYLERQLRLLPG